ncbi:MAG: enoyl-CoA hydratase/isomerase family protein [Candidatus Lokiarchaeota archaeon]|nr:enoyl-CoA hydratase/isomerase family protein [Candidatus Lokiarchaeota archaeon]
MIQYDTIELDISETDECATLYLNRPEQLNAINRQMCLDFISAMKSISKKDFVRCILIAARGPAFCAGGDLAEFQKAKDPGTHLYELASIFHGGIKILKSINAPSIAAINGPCFGVGFSLACACDIRICAQGAKFNVAFTNIGLTPDSSLTYYLPKIIGLPLTNEMVYLNKVLTSKDALENRLVSKVYGDIKCMQEGAEKLIAKIKNGPTLAYGNTKKLLLNSYKNDLNTHLDRELESVSKMAGTQDFQEGMSSFFERRRPNYKGK